MGVLYIEMLYTNKTAHFTYCFEHIFQEPEHMHMDLFQYVK
jgi:hypothetical protein